MSRAKKLIEELYSMALKNADWIDLALLEGAGLSRINTWATSGVPYAMVTASRHSNNSSENDRLNSEMISNLNSMGLGGIQLIGYWQEDGDSAPTREQSFFVPDADNKLSEPDFRKLMASICRQYNQDAVLYCDGEKIGFLDQSGSFSPTFGRVSFGDSLIKQGWSELRGKKFTMVEGAFLSGNIAGRELWGTLNLLPVVAFEREALKRVLELKKNA